ncbi:isochorismatase family protein [Streptomyces sp. NPDC001941]|uniref:isochorismatase family protein n=1 Tax=Streptomyces sp. NPDC001941 TaxID=3154659 RepID=UPI00332899B6
MTSSTAPAAPVQALLLVDLQSAFVHGEGAVPHAEELVAHARDLLQRARAAGAFVVHLQNDGPEGADDETGTPGWELHLPVREGAREHVVRKEEDDGFAGTRLRSLLDDAGVGALAVCGVMSEMCVSATARTALRLDYRVVVPHDAHGTYDVPAAEGIAPLVPARTVSRVAEWALGDRAEVVARAADVTFEAVATAPATATTAPATDTTPATAVAPAPASDSAPDSAPVVTDGGAV